MSLEPKVNPPPWIQTITACGGLSKEPMEFVKTFRVRQSSDIFSNRSAKPAWSSSLPSSVKASSSKGLACCIQVAPSEKASYTFVHGDTGTGGLNLNFPTGGSA